MNLTFKKELRDGLFTWLYVSGHSVNDMSENDILNVRKAKEYEKRFYDYLDFAEFLVVSLEKQILMRFSPFLNETGVNLKLINWKYEVLSSDLYGTGIDKGFVSADKSEFEQEALFAVNDIDQIKTFPEDTFGDSLSHVTIFGLNKRRTNILASLLQTSDKPDLSLFLQPGEIFIHITYGKDYNYFDSVMVKSKNDIQEAITAFLNAMDAGN